ncbi:cytochrome o quinol oxidase subunit IV [Fictibacillus macauensis ZFHKF-1]|uniref:Cytochrome o quinol oxidase subunit IV n=1 Tax=Fictibacillus macauensis ZFHKF-1 TaxID=1196324 RepID=I8UJE4_9BACL|nr:cytochrome o ubiquinol oxidase subunit IV [Fictibacillus macauensis]EIT86980.1 cytochrome o quinol oxidase subunit IV [Fictibacillus macauensis ZFHKF-1]
MEENHGSTKLYVMGFVLSLILTVIPLWLVVQHVFAKGMLTIVITAIAVGQLLIQLFCFMHIKDGEKPRYHAIALVLGAVIVFTIVAGSIWIMTFNSQVH